MRLILICFVMLLAWPCWAYDLPDDIPPDPYAPTPAQMQAEHEAWQEYYGKVWKIEWSKFAEQQAEEQAAIAWRSKIALQRQETCTKGNCAEEIATPAPQLATVANTHVAYTPPERSILVKPVQAVCRRVRCCRQRCWHHVRRWRECR